MNHLKSHYRLNMVHSAHFSFLPTAIYLAQHVCSNILLYDTTKRTLLSQSSALLSRIQIGLRNINILSQGFWSPRSRHKIELCKPQMGLELPKQTSEYYGLIGTLSRCWYYFGLMTHVIRNFCYLNKDVCGSSHILCVPAYLSIEVKWSGHKTKQSNSLMFKLRTPEAAHPTRLHFICLR